MDRPATVWVPELFEGISLSLSLHVGKRGVASWPPPEGEVQAQNTPPTGLVCRMCGLPVSVVHWKQLGPVENNTYFPSVSHHIKERGGKTCGRAPTPMHPNGEAVLWKETSHG